MAQFRRDPIIGQWVIVHTDDSWAPKEYKKEEHPFKQEKTCQFCPGREYLTPPEIDSIRASNSYPNSSGWKVRVVSNKFPALKIEGNIDQHRRGIFDFSNGIGAHEVVIETTDHHKNLADFTEEEIFDVIEKYQSRLIDLARDDRFKYIIIFKNYGESAGTTVEHAHSQIIALPLIPKYVLEELKGAKVYFEKNNRCVFCDMVVQEQKDKERIVVENNHFIAFCPFVPRYPFECWILPKKHTSDFALITDEEQFALSGILKEVLLRLKECLSDPSYNFYLHISPVNCQGPEAKELLGNGDADPHWLTRFHWHIEIVPKLTQTSGFEWGTGFYVVRTAPHLAAKYLREII